MMRLTERWHRFRLKRWEKTPRCRQIRDCPHLNREPSPDATAIQPPRKAGRCLDCGIGIVTMTPLDAHCATTSAHPRPDGLAPRRAVSEGLETPHSEET